VFTPATETERREAATGVAAAQREIAGGNVAVRLTDSVCVASRGGCSAAANPPMSLESERTKTPQKAILNSDCTKAPAAEEAESVMSDGQDSCRFRGLQGGYP